jgi:hypothetical protein
MSVLAQEVLAQQRNVIGRLFTGEEKRIVFAAHYDESPAAVAVLVEFARTAISSPTPPAIGVDLAFLDGRSDGENYFRSHLAELYPDTKPIEIRMIDRVYQTGLADASPGGLETVANALLKEITQRSTP